MQLKERQGYLNSMRSGYEKMLAGSGNTILISGEAGIGKTALVKQFRQHTGGDDIWLEGCCDALFTPRPLAPLLDILLQLNPADIPATEQIERPELFSRAFMAISCQQKPVIIVFEDVHWADEASLDFIKFFSRRIGRLRCMFILTSREEEMDSRHPLSFITGQLTSDSFTRLRLFPLSKEAVGELSVPKGFNGGEVFAISGGNPFYVTEILANYSSGIPEKIKDAILSVFHRQDAATRELWKWLSVLPQGLLLDFAANSEKETRAAMERSLQSGILVLQENRIVFKHELYRRTIEVSLSPFLRLSLNKKMLGMLLAGSYNDTLAEPIIHFAKNANDAETVVRFAPAAAAKASALGAHAEAARLYKSAIEFYQGGEPALLIRFYQGYSYECYLTNQINEAIIFTGKAYSQLSESGDRGAIGNALRFLSRLWWYAGNRMKAESFGMDAIGAFGSLPVTPAKALAYSNMAQLKMLSDDLPGCLEWGRPAIDMARETGDDNVLTHALNNVGTCKMLSANERAEGEALLRQSLTIALDNGYHEHAARSYTNLGSNLLIFKEYTTTSEILDQGIRFCDERDLDSWSVYMSSMKARLFLETGKWMEADRIATLLLQNPDQPAVSKIIVLVVLGTVRMRTGTAGSLSLLLDAMKLAAETREPQRIIPALAALFEWEWLNESEVVGAGDLEQWMGMAKPAAARRREDLDFWLRFPTEIQPEKRQRPRGSDVADGGTARSSAVFWQDAGNSYQQALCLWLGNEEDKRQALEIMLKAGAFATAERMKRGMRKSGIKQIPRGMRKSTRTNPSLLTLRELELLPLLRDGLQNKEIAARLFISPKTVDHHISAIYSKLEVRTRARAVQEALRLKILAKG